MATLYRGHGNCGVTPILTEDAAEAQTLRQEYFDLYGTYDGCDPELLDRVKAGTMTFVQAARYARQRAQVVYTGSYELLDLLATVHTIQPYDRPLFVPFSCSPVLWEELVQDGYGPNTVVVDALLAGHMGRAED